MTDFGPGAGQLPPEPVGSRPGRAAPAAVPGEGRGSRPAGPILVPEAVLLQFLTALHTRPLVLLAGISGSGKTQLAQRIGQARANG